MTRIGFSGKERGQVLLIVVLVLVIGLVVGLSVAARTITNLRISTEEENSQRAFSAAEAGIEQLLNSGDSSIPPTDFDNKTQYSATSNSISGTQFLINDGKTVFKDDGVDIWLVDHNADGSLNYSSGWQSPLITGNRNISFHWGDSATGCNEAAFEIIAITGSSAAPRTTRYGVDPCNARRVSNKFSSADNRPYSSAGQNFYFEYTITINNDVSKGIVVRVIPLYASARVAIRACNNNGLGGGNCTPLPSQGSRVESIGTDTTSNTARKIAVFQGFPKLPNEFFQYSLFNP